MIKSNYSKVTDSKIMSYLDQFLPILQEEVLKMKQKESLQEYALNLEKRLQRYSIMPLSGRLVYLMKHYICYCYRPYFPNNNFLLYKVFCQWDEDFKKIFTENDPNYSFFRRYFQYMIDYLDEYFRNMERIAKYKRENKYTLDVI